MARPRIKIDHSQFEKLCGLQCTKEEVAGFFDCSEDTIDRFCKREYNTSFAVVYKNKSQSGIISVRRNLFKLSEKNASACIFLAKNLLGYTDDGVRTADSETTSLLKSINEVLHEDIDELES